MNYLLVDITVGQKNQNLFEEAMNAFLDAGGFGRLVKACKHMTLQVVLRSEPYKYENPAFDDFATGTSNTVVNRRNTPREQVIRYVHLWRLPNASASALNRLIEKCGGDRQYLKIDRNVLHEAQYFVSSIFPAQERGWPQKGTRVARIVRDMAGRDLYPTRTTPVLPKWTFFNALRATDGLLRRFFEFWGAGSTRSSLPPRLTPLLKTTQAQLSDSFTVIEY